MLKSFLTAVCAASAIVSYAAEDTVFKSFTLDNDGAAVKAGTVVKCNAKFECQSGYVLAGWSAGIIRKNAPAEFFSAPGVKVNPHKTAKDYDGVRFANYLHFGKAMKSGEFPVAINTAGMVPGDYAIHIQGRFMKENVKGQSFYRAATLYISITEKDNGKFAISPQVMPAAARKAATPTQKYFKKEVITPETVSAKAGSKVPIALDFEALDGEKILGYSVGILRKESDPAIFNNPAFKVIRHKTAPGYDSIRLKEYVRFAPTGATVKANFELDLTNFSAGEYSIRVTLHTIKADGNPRYTANFVNVSVK